MLLICFLLLLPTLLDGQPARGRISGRVITADSGESLPNCNILILPGRAGVATDEHGRFEFILPFDRYSVEFRYLGYETVKQEVVISSSHSAEQLLVKMTPVALTSEVVTVLGEASTDASIQTLEAADIRRMPTVGSDVLKSLKILPGVSSNNELSSSYNVRGGNYDENLIYLNGYEIYRPALLRQGVEENQSLINPDMVENLRFFGAAFPARFGDKLASALEVNYARQNDGRLSAISRADLLNLGVVLRGQSGRLKWTLGTRYSNPALFVNKLQTSGNYKPRFADLQLLMDYAVGDRAKLELFALAAENKFDLTPNSWSGHFAFGALDVKGVDIAWQGEQTYDFDTRLLGLRYRHQLSAGLAWSLSLSRYLSSETESSDLQGDLFFVPNAREPSRNREFLKTRFERSDNRLQIRRWQASHILDWQTRTHAFSVGATARWVNLNNRLDETELEVSDATLVVVPRVENAALSAAINSFSVFVQDRFSPADWLSMEVGARLARYPFGGETLFSPRLSAHLSPLAGLNVHLGAGVYFQPPFAQEVRNKSSSAAKALRAQKAIHTLVGIDYDLGHRLKIQMEGYYKDFDRLLPYRQEQLKLIYGDSNDFEGFSYGLDIALKGEIVDGIKSWLSYGYLKSRERRRGDAVYVRRVLDQTHTLRFFLQDKMPRYSNVRAHTRILFGSGFLFHPQVVSSEPGTDLRVLATDFSSREKYRSYFRVDLGFTVEIARAVPGRVLISAEVLNVWNVANVADNLWFDIPQVSSSPVRIPQVFTKRFFNLGVEVRL